VYHTSSVQYSSPNHCIQAFSVFMASSTMPTNVLVWPSSLPLHSHARTTSSNNLKHKPPKEHGFVIGWEEECGKGANSSSTIIVAGIMFVPIEQIRERLKYIKEDKYCSWCKNQHSCLSCKVILQDLKVVARWTGNHLSKSTAESHSDSNIVSLPTISLSEKGPLVDFRCPQLITFEPCINAEDCYRHDHDLSSTYKSMKLAGVTQRAHFNSLQRLLLRISETETMMDDLREITTTKSKGSGGLERNCLQAIEEITVDDDESPTEKCISNNRSLCLIHLALNRQRDRELMGMMGHSDFNLRRMLRHLPIVNAISMFKVGWVTNETYFIPREMKANYRLRWFSMMMSCIIDAVLGMCLGIFLIFRNQTAIELALVAWRGFNVQLLGSNIGWLETFPVGFKLNVPLTRVMGQNIMSFTKMYERVLLCIISTFNVSVSIQILGWVSIIFGCRACASVIHDLAKAATGHIQLIYCVFRAFFHTQLLLFSSLWHLFRGKKKNVLRKRSDTLEYDFMQLFLGMILFATCLFLFTTVFVYYFFFSLVQLVVSFSIGIVWSFYLGATCFPLGDIILAAYAPNGFRCKVSFAQRLSDDDGSEMTFLQIKSSSLTTGWLMIEAVKTHFKLLR